MPDLLFSAGFEELRQKLMVSPPPRSALCVQYRREYASAVVLRKVEGTVSHTRLRRLSKLLDEKYSAYSTLTTNVYDSPAPGTGLRVFTARFLADILVLICLASSNVKR